VRELVIAITDLYLPPGEAEPALTQTPLPALAALGRYGERALLAAGWRGWLLEHLGHHDLVDLSPACVAGAAGAAAAPAALRWLAAPLHLGVGSAQVRLEPDGLLRLSAAHAAELAAAFGAAFPGALLSALAADAWLLDAAGLSAVPIPEPARCLGRELAPLLPRGAAAAPLRRLTGEIELWLHALPLNAARLARGEAPVSTLWLWGAAGRQAHPAPRAPREPWLAFGGDAFVRGLWHLRGGACGELVQALPALAADGANTLWLLELGQELRHDGTDTPARALARLDASYLGPAVAALGAGVLGRVTLLANDRRLTLRRTGRLRLWRRPRPALAALA